MTRTDEEENKSIKDHSVSLIWSIFKLVWQTVTVCCVPFGVTACPPSRWKKSKFPTEGDIASVILLFVILQLGFVSSLSDFRLCMFFLLASGIQNCWVCGASTGERRLPFCGSVLAEPHFWLSETPPPSVNGKMFARHICHGVLLLRTKRGSYISGFIPEWILVRDGNGCLMMYAVANGRFLPTSCPTL